MFKLIIKNITDFIFKPEKDTLNAFIDGLEEGIAFNLSLFSSDIPSHEKAEILEKLQQQFNKYPAIDDDQNIEKFVDMLVEVMNSEQLSIYAEQLIFLTQISVDDQFKEIVSVLESEE